MKVCPSCDRTYHDDELNFCLMCGTSLVDGASQPTVAISGASDATSVIDPRATVAEPARKHGPLFWIGVTVACIATVTGATISIFFLYFMFTSDTEDPKGQNRNAKVVTPRKDKQKPTPSSTASPKPSPETTPTLNKADDIRSITWENTALEFKADEDETRTFFCPVFGKEFAIFGTDTYAANSSICTAAVHVGLIDFEEGGEVTIRFRRGLPNYLVTTRHGVTSNMFGNEDLSFVFVFSED
ncbi:MAG: LCCL domain-containing protein [Pyrinomonadaceae bacterium]